MGVNEILNFLEDNKNTKYFAREIINATNKSSSSVFRLLCKLRRNRSIKCDLKKDVHANNKITFIYWVE